MTRLNVAEAKKQFSDLLGRVAYGGETIVITRRGRPLAQLGPLREVEARHLADVQGWLDDDDPFLSEVNRIVAARTTHVPRVLAQPKKSAVRKRAR